MAEVIRLLEVDLFQGAAIRREATVEFDIPRGKPSRTIQKSLRYNELSIIAHRKLHDRERPVLAGIRLKRHFLHVETEALKQHTLLVGMPHLILNRAANRDLGADIGGHSEGGIGPCQHCHL